MLPVNRACFGDAKGFHPFALSCKTLYCASLCVDLHGYLTGLSEKVLLYNLALWKDANAFKDVTLVVAFLACNSLLSLTLNPCAVQWGKVERGGGRGDWHILLALDSDL